MVRGQWGGDSEARGLQEHGHKGEMDKIKGEGGGGGESRFSCGGMEGWGEKAHNCN